MIDENYTSIQVICDNYKIDSLLIHDLFDHDIIDIYVVENEKYIHHDYLSKIEKIKRLHFELNINIEGIATILDLLSKNESLEYENLLLRNQLEFYKDTLNNKNG